MKKPTVEELEQLLNEEKEYPIVVMPNGEIKTDRRRRGSGFIMPDRKSSSY